MRLLLTVSLIFAAICLYLLIPINPCPVDPYAEMRQKYPCAPSETTVLDWSGAIHVTEGKDPSISICLPVRSDNWLGTEDWHKPMEF